jgi:hypothetical protein
LPAALFWVWHLSRDPRKHSPFNADVGDIAGEVRLLLKIEENP